MSNCTTGLRSCKRKRNTDNDSSQEHIKIVRFDPEQESGNPKVKWKVIRAENLACDIVTMYNKPKADELLDECERILSYNTGQLTKIRVFGKWHSIPRKQVFRATITSCI